MAYEDEYLPTNQRNLKEKMAMGSTMEPSFNVPDEKPDDITKEDDVDVIDFGKELPEDLLEFMDSADRTSTFKFPLGTQVRNNHNEDGYVKMCAIDFRGDYYIVQFKGGRCAWYSEYELKRVSFNYDKDEKSLNPNIKMDIPDEKNKT